MEGGGLKGQPQDHAQPGKEKYRCRKKREIEMWRWIFLNLIFFFTVPEAEKLQFVCL